MSMAAIIKSQDQDSWGGGSAGSLTAGKTPTVAALGGVLCQYAEHTCQGVYHCSASVVAWYGVPAVLN
jgi:hypothetical protein